MRNYPTGWRKTLHELLKEKGQPEPEEIEWARAYGREQLKAWARFPKDRVLFEALHDIEITCLTHWEAPFTGSEKVILPEGTRIKVEVHLDNEPIGVYATPIEYERLESVLVPASDREHHKYGGYSVSVTTAQLNKDFRLVEN